MREIKTDHWSLLIPEDWLVEQDEETICIEDPDSVSSLEITTILPSQGNNLIEVSNELKEGKKAVDLFDIKTFYHEITEEGYFWREWVCSNDNQIVLISHGCEENNKHYDDALIDEILSTLVILD